MQKENKVKGASFTDYCFNLPSRPLSETHVQMSKDTKTYNTVTNS